MNFLLPRQRLALWLIVITALIDVVCLAFGKLQFYPVWSVWLLLCTIAIGLILSKRLPWAKLSLRKKHLITDLGLLILFAPVGFILSYLATSHSGASFDAQLVQLDKRIGFDWLSYHSFFLQNPWFRSFSLLFYLLIPVFPVFCLIALCQKSNFNAAADAVAVIMLTGLICIGISALVPAYGAAGYYQPESDFYKGYNILFDYEYKQTIIALNQGRDVTIRIWQPIAVIAFPSYHASLAALTILLSWSISKWFWWMLLINVAGMLAIPVDGGHHLVDVLAGLLVSIVTFAFIRHLTAQTLHRIS